MRVLGRDSFMDYFMTTYLFAAIYVNNGRYLWVTLGTVDSTELYGILHVEIVLLTLIRLPSSLRGTGAASTGSINLCKSVFIIPVYCCRFRLILGIYS